MIFQWKKIQNHLNKFLDLHKSQTCTLQTPEMHHWSTPQKMLKKSCVFTKFFHLFFLLKNTLIIYNLFKFYFLKKSFLFCAKKGIKSGFKCYIFISLLYKKSYTVLYHLYSAKHLWNRWNTPFKYHFYVCKSNGKL